MNTNQLKTYAPKARLKFIEAIKTKLRTLGIEEGKIAEVERSGDFIFIQKQPFPKSIESARQQIIQKIEKLDFEQVLEQYAYTWFNRLCAIRFMELHDGYLDHGYRVLSHSQREQGLEFLDSAVEVAEYFGLDSKEIIDLKLEHQDEQLYRKLLLAQCNQLHDAMPFLFDPIDSVTSLLLPDDLTRSDSIIMDLVQQVDEDSWQQVEIIGWLYQFYISDLKAQVFAQKTAIKIEDIPYATQLFTPNWIVKYMVQNSLGRYWLQTYPDTVVTIDGEEKRLKEVLEYYIEPAEQEDGVKAQLAEITPQSIDPTTIKVIDPASGSGHILVEAYDLLKLIYQSQGHSKRDIPKLILENNIFGLDIDDRAEQLTGFALMMKARQDDRRIFGRGTHLNICAFQNSDELDAAQLWQALNLNAAWQAGSHVDMFGQAQADLGAEETDPRYVLIQDLVEKFKDAKAFGSLLSVDNSHEATLFDLKTTLKDLAVNGDSLQKGGAEKLLPIVEQAWILSQRYDAVIANPPYMGGGGMNANLKAFAKKYFPDSKSDLFAMFMEHSFSLLKPNGFNAQVNMQSWMFLSSYEKLREKLLESKTIMTMAHLGARAFGQISGEVVQTTTFVIQNNYIQNYQPTFFRLVNGNEQEKITNLLVQNFKFFQVKQHEFKEIPSSPIAYWVSNNVRKSFIQKSIKDYLIPKQGLATGNNDKFLRFWWEISKNKTSHSVTTFTDSENVSAFWFPYSKGGESRKWYGSNEYVVYFPNAGNEIRNYKDEQGRELSRFRASAFYFKEAITWSLTSSSSNGFAARFRPTGYVFDINGMSAFGENIYQILVFLNTKVGTYFLNLINPTMAYQIGDISKLPIHQKTLEPSMLKKSISAIETVKNNWDSYEISWDFNRLQLFVCEKENLIESFQDTRRKWLNVTEVIQQLEKNNNAFFIEVYGLEDELTPDVPLKDVTLTCNPYYRYGSDATEEQLEQRLQSDTIAELISYAIGCMMGRYSLDREGLVYAHEGNAGFDELISEGAYKKFPADDDGILPLLDEERFPDDVYSRFEQFIATAWDKETLQQNLDFIAESLRLYNIKPKNGESSAETIRRYLSNNFYKDQHLKTYKSRPIYWLFSSGKQKAFECLVYMHRFNETTLAKMRTQYVLPLMGQLTARAQFLADADKDTSLSPAEKTKYAKEADSLHKKLNELKDFDAELKHHIEQKISIDLDDGVKVNYGKFAKLLAEAKKVTGNKE
ncbi:putative type II restriction enzyme methylase subunit [Acinetobacter guillouiae MSP4-18]|uniref:BREX-1 system adenine-specific DNA-methyltransferase PglX n=1 Tax=Acinetobacter guillouiae TaxID=106649 RepID=UPI0003532F80|nr:BREX-1 system adenine-specific DNA-methyltransferase PglX [Acinetobacter guillouiae]EPH37544.1 putative type II restriction enzyme methylase subunit [Acinetobacter guillouiae MSP4-18]KAB0629714.1 BREX-1 system adenine-specific DNA-methyltransferase PglX [Acinetobacter guillouiae]